jgi:hypothetical protein
MLERGTGYQLEPGPPASISLAPGGVLTQAAGRPWHA